MLLAGSTIEPETASAFEVAVFRAFNDAPDFLYPVVWPLMQYGTFITIPIATVVALLFRKVRLAVEMARRRRRRLQAGQAGEGCVPARATGGRARRRASAGRPGR